MATSKTQLFLAHQVKSGSLLELTVFQKNLEIPVTASPLLHYCEKWQLVPAWGKLGQAAKHWISKTSVSVPVGALLRLVSCTVCRHIGQVRLPSSKINAYPSGFKCSFGRSSPWWAVQRVSTYWAGATVNTKKHKQFSLHTARCEILMNDSSSSSVHIRYCLKPGAHENGFQF